MTGFFNGGGTRITGDDKSLLFELLYLLLKHRLSRGVLCEELSSVGQQSSSSSPNTTHELQASSIPGWTSPDPSNTMPPPSNNNRGRNVYGCMVDVSKLTPEQRQQHAVMLLQHYHEFCNTNKPSLVSIYPPHILIIESLSQSTISSLYSE